MGGWRIVKFPHENSIETVPSSWLHTSKDGTGGILCWWPNTISKSKISFAIKSQQLPEDDWKSYSAVILSRTIYNDFVTASKKAEQAEYTSGIDTDLENSTKPNDKFFEKRTRKKNPRYISSSEEDEVVSYSPMANTRRSPRFKLPTPPKIQKRQSQTSVSTTKTSEQLSAISGAVVNSPLSPLCQSDSSNSFSKAIANVRSNLNGKLSEVGQPSSSCHVLFDKKSFTEIIKLLHIINGRVTQNTELIMTIIDKVQNSKSGIIEEQPSQRIEILENLPAKSAKELVDLDSALDDINIKSVLIKELIYAGGSNVKEVIKRMFPKVVNDEVLKEYSWVGGKGKKSFSSLVNLCNVVKEVVKQNPTIKFITEKSVEEVIAIFLSKATERCTRKMAKAVNSQTE